MLEGSTLWYTVADGESYHLNRMDLSAYDAATGTFPNEASELDCSDRVLIGDGEFYFSYHASGDYSGDLCDFHAVS